MNRSLSFPNMPFLRNRQPNLANLENLLDYLPDASLLIDLEKGGIILANAKATELTAFTRTELINSRIEDLLPFLSNHIRDLTETNQPETYIDTLSTRQGATIEVHVELAPLDHLGNWGLVICEPSEYREKIVSYQRRRSERLSNLVNLARSTLDADSERGLILALEAGRKLTGADIIALFLADGTQPGLKRKIVQGSPEAIPDFIAPEDVKVYLEPTTWEPGDRAANLLSRSARIAKLGYIQTYPLGDKEAIIGILVLAAEQGGIPEDNATIAEILLATISGIIQQKSILENLLSLEKSQQHDLLIGKIIKESTQDGVILLSRDLLIEELNPQAETLLGYASKEIYGQPANNVLIGPSNLVPALQSAQLGVTTPNLGEVHLHRRDGVAFLAHISTIPLLDGESIDGVIILIRDLSAHEESEIRSQQLEQRALLGEVTAIFAHEVRNPINNISTGLQLMAINLPPDDPNQEVITRLLDDCNRLTHLMQSVLTFSRPPENKFQAVELAELIPVLLERWRPRLARLNIRHEFRTKTEDSIIWGDTRALEQVFSNLIGNSVEAMKETGGSLSIHIRPSHLEGGRQHIEVNVIDDGPGIPQDLIDRIFEPFVTTNRNGTGLGLSIAKRIVSAHKGVIKVSSVPGGTVFQITFPLFQETEV
jgi:two-component system sensor histidine kinase AtoS